MNHSLAHLQRLACDCITLEQTLPVEGRLCHPDELPAVEFIVRASGMISGEIHAWVVPCVTAREAAAVITMYDNDPDVLSVAWELRPRLGDEPLWCRGRDRSRALARAFALERIGLSREIDPAAHEIPALEGENLFVPMMLTDDPLVRTILLQSGSSGAEIPPEQ